MKIANCTISFLGLDNQYHFIKPNEPCTLINYQDKYSIILNVGVEVPVTKETWDEVDSRLETKETPLDELV